MGNIVRVVGRIVVGPIGPMVVAVIDDRREPTRLAVHMRSRDSDRLGQRCQGRQHEAEHGKKGCQPAKHHRDLIPDSHCQIANHKGDKIGPDLGGSHAALAVS